MKKIFSVITISVFTLSYSQTYVKVTSDKNQLETVYAGGQQKFNTDLSDNLQYTGNAFQVNGDFKLNFNIDEDGKISEVKLLPELFDKSFEREVKRDLGRIKKHFVSNQKQNVSVSLSFSRDIPDHDGRAFLTCSKPYANIR
ncbi:hypothetical protein [Chryseobacterium populi]|uniref:TonB C-terminal domain-containing protein n=1 Tax=Chryseobacterium populi TaxID=1144316 RepID=J2K0N2_9FLAO|nr:hypothetical protein [Chryseobacterium populi]EJL73700.1 hypothetical protein PMI13_01462 [Chryseobacterium populi]